MSLPAARSIRDTTAMTAENSMTACLGVVTEENTYLSGADR